MGLRATVGKVGGGVAGGGASRGNVDAHVDSANVDTPVTLPARCRTEATREGVSS